MEITGRLTADAAATTTRSGKEVVNFSIAINDSYRPKGAAEVKEVTTYVNCAYWKTIQAAGWLKKGTLVQLHGRIGINVYNNLKGDAVGSLTFHVNDIKVIVFAKKQQQQTAPATTAAANTPPVNSEQVDDLPF